MNPSHVPRRRFVRTVTGTAFAAPFARIVSAQQGAKKPGVALVGLAPRFAAVAWGALGLCVILGLVGAALQLDQWVMNLSPFTHLPKVPGGALTATPLAVLLAVALALGGAGLAGLRRREIPVT